MKLTPELQLVLDEVAIDVSSQTIKVTPRLAAATIALVDLTSLNDDDTADTVKALCARAVTKVGAVAAVCVWPAFVKVAAKALKGQPVAIATVINFPGGDQDVATVVSETTAAIAAGAGEIDLVMPYGAYIDGARSQPANLVRACREACGEGVKLKVILESGAFPDPDLLGWAARDMIAAGADFLKTSTGKLQPGATLEAAAVILHTIHESGKEVGFKASGGIRDGVSAASYMALASRIMGKGWVSSDHFRLGTSGLLDELLETAGS